MQHNKLFVFDIETVPDTQAVRNLTGCDSQDISVLRMELEKYHLNITDGKNPFPRQPFHKVVAISFLEADIMRNGSEESYSLTELRSGGNENSTEKELLEGFFQYVGRITPRLVSYNGRTFDLPVLKYRAMAHGIQAPWLYKTGDKWNSYTSRYSLDWHCDLLEALSDFGASARCKLNEICSILGLPGKVGVDGSQVTELFDKKKIKEIRDYCETDVLNTYLVYLRYMHHIGTLSTDNYMGCVEDVASLVKMQASDKAHMQEFVDEWEVA
ncbi:3'-5' exonuclease [Rickettsiales bacterium]|nr:3'-5' exonuclease [Rickettsiales bacterium]